MENDKGCLCCLPSGLAPIIIVLTNFVLFEYLDFFLPSWFNAIVFVSLLTVICTLSNEESALARLLLLLVYIMEAVLFWVVIWMAVVLGSS